MIEKPSEFMMFCQNVYLDDIMVKSNLGYVGSKTRSLGQIIEKPCKHSRCRIFASIVMIFCQKFILMILPLRKKCTAVNNFREQLANTLRLFGKHNLIWLTSIHGMFARCSLFSCKLGMRGIL